MNVEFRKYEGLGNDFIVVDTRAWPATNRSALGPEAAQRLCDRHFGVGADGVLRLEPGAPGTVARMTVLNADGSVAEMCGNGLRCVARYLRDVGEAVTPEIIVDTGAGPLPCRFIDDDVEVSLGAVTDGGVALVEVDGLTVRGRHISLGNPHFVVSAPGGRDEAARIGEALQRHAAFPAGVNVSSRRFTGPGAATLHVYERGCGLTLACGTGAGATAATAWLDGDVAWGTPLQIGLPGGTLVISGGLDGLWLKGPARAVFQGVTTL